MGNTDIATGDLTDEIIKLKSQNGMSIIVYGSASFDSSLIKAGLFDEFYLFINPVAIGSGMNSISYFGILAPASNMISSSLSNLLLSLAKYREFSVN